MSPLTRRDFLKGTGGLAVGLSLSRLGFRFAGTGSAGSAQEEVFRYYAYSGWEDLYRKKWTWDKVTWGTHLVDCYPGGCSFHVYTKDGVVWREEQSAVYPQIEEGVPDMNPRGCQKGAVRRSTQVVMRLNSIWMVSTTTQKAVSAVRFQGW